MLPRVRQWIYVFLEEGQLDSLAGRIVEGLLVALIVANGRAVALETIPSIGLAYRGAFQIFERASLLIYSLEYLPARVSLRRGSAHAAKGRSAAGCSSRCSR